MRPEEWTSVVASASEYAKQMPEGLEYSRPPGRLSGRTRGSRVARAIRGRAGDRRGARRVRHSPFPVLPDGHETRNRLWTRRGRPSSRSGRKRIWKADARRSEEGRAGKEGRTGW